MRRLLMNETSHLCRYKSTSANYGKYAIAQQTMTSMKVLINRRKRLDAKKSDELSMEAPTDNFFLDKVIGEKAILGVKDVEIEKRLKDVSETLSAMRTRLEIVDDEINRIVDSRKRTKTFGPDEKLTFLKQRRNEITQYKLKELGRVFGDIIVQTVKSPYCTPDDTRRALDMFQRDFDARAFHFNALIQAYGTAHRMDLAVDAYHEMRDRKIEPDRWTYMKIAQGFANMPELRARECNLWLGRMAAAGFRPDYKALDIALLASARARDTTACVKLIRMILKEDEVPRRDTLRRALSAFLSEDAMDQWAEVQNEILDCKGLEIDPDIVSSMLQALCKKGLFEHCKPLLDVMKNRGALKRLDKEVIKMIAKMYKMRGLNDEARKLQSLVYKV